jgi:hypothetical protein
MMRMRRSALATLVALALMGCALSDDFAIAPVGEGVESSQGGASVAVSHGGSGRGGSTGGSPQVRGGSSGTAKTGGTGGSVASDAGGETGIGEGGSDSGCIPEPEICDGVSNDCDDEIDEGAECPTDCSIRSYDGHLYALCLFADEDEWVTHPEATTACTKLAAKLGSSSAFRLVWIESEPENDFLKNWIAATTPTSSEVMVWTGANDLNEERTWVWGQTATAARFFDQSSDGGGKPYGDAFNDFASGKPNSANDRDEDCGGFDSEFAWQWNDFLCSDPRLGYVCEERQ